MKNTTTSSLVAAASLLAIGCGPSVYRADYAPVTVRAAAPVVAKAAPPPKVVPMKKVVMQRLARIADRVHFHVGSTELLDSSKKTLDKVVRLLQRHRGVAIEIQGHTDATGNADKNRVLSAGRADSVRAYLVSKGVAADRLTAKGFGPSRPRAGNDTASGRQQNRRVEFHIASTNTASNGG